MARNLSHLTGHELAALAAPFENPSYARSARKSLITPSRRRKYMYTPEYGAMLNEYLEQTRMFRQLLDSIDRDEALNISNQVLTALPMYRDEMSGSENAGYRFALGAVLKFLGKDITGASLLEFFHLEWPGEDTPPYAEFTFFAENHFNRVVHGRG